MTEKPKRLEWREGRYMSEYGSAGGTELFTIGRRTQSGHPDWQMRTTLPGLDGERWEISDRDALKAQAETVLADWLARVSGTED